MSIKNLYLYIKYMIKTKKVCNLSVFIYKLVLKYIKKEFLQERITMLPIERQKKILDLLTIKKVIKIPEIIEEFNISLETVRRDLNTLEADGKIEKIYGGAKLVEIKYGEDILEQRRLVKLPQKEALAQKCSEWINDGDCIYIDSGSTTYHIAKYIKNKKNITVITNSIPVVNELIGSDIEVIIIGGKLRRNEHSIISTDYLFNFNELNILKAFICAGGISIQNGISDYHTEEAITRKKVIERSKDVFVVADSSKFGKDAMINIMPLQKVSYLITDCDLSPILIKTFKKSYPTLITTEY